MTKVSRLFDIPYFQLENYPIEDALATKYTDHWEKTSSQEYVNLINQTSRALLRLGVQPNDKIAVVSSNNRTEWHILDMAIMQVGAQSVPVYPTVSNDDFCYILNHAQCKICFASDEHLFRKVETVKAQIPTLQTVFTFDEVAGAKTWKELLVLGEDTSNQAEVQQIMQGIQPDDLATIIYTSGTTGRPKGVMLSHRNIVSNIICCQPRVPVSAGDKCLSFLPVCHIFERMLTTLYQYFGIRLYFAQSMDKIAQNLQEVQPQLMTVVPRLVEKVFDSIYSKGAELKGFKRMLFFWALNLGYQYQPYGANGWWYALKLWVARKLVFSKWKEALGGNLVMISGSASLQSRLVRVFSAAGIPIWEGYGLTETAPVISVNCFKNKEWKIGTIGKPINGVEVKIAPDGEILCKGENIMLGYYKNEEQTREVMDADGFFHTGDIGELDADGFLKITDRKKEMFKTSGGKYIAPQDIENMLRTSRFIEQAMVVGDGEKMPGAFIQPNFAFLRKWAKRHQISEHQLDNASLLALEVVRERLGREVEEINQKLGKWEQVKVFDFTPEEWSVELGHLTPTLKLKRRVIIEKYQDIYKKFYGHNKE